MKKQPENKEHLTEYPHKALQAIEDERDGFLSYYRRNNSIKIVVTILCLILIIVSCLVFPNVLPESLGKGKNAFTYVGAIVAVVALILYSTLTRKRTDRKMREYFKYYYGHTNEYVFENKGFDKVELQEPGKINLEQFTDCHLYKDVIEVGSRGLTEFEFNNIPMAVVDCAGNIKGEKRMLPVFVGKYLFAAASYTGEDPVIVYIKGNERSLPPTNLDGIKKVSEEVKYDIYSNFNNWKKVITADVLKLIESIKTDKILVDLAICVYGGRAFVMMGYDDPLMILPLQNAFDSKPVEQYKKNLLTVCKLVEALNK